LIELIPYYHVVHFNYTGGVDNHNEYLKQYGFYNRCVLTITNERSLLEGNCVKIPILEEMMQKVAKVTSVSEKIAKMYNCEYLPNGVDLEFFNPPKNVVVGFIGVKADRKGYSLVEQACKELGLTLKCLFYQGKQIPFSEMPNFYRSIDVLVHPSVSEGCSNVILEALSMNVDVITTKTGIWDKLGTNITIIENDYDNILNVLNNYITRNFIKENYNWEKICRRYKEIYERIV
jgi:glycosyltransferase involved in cell wall biosynthesis